MCVRIYIYIYIQLSCIDRCGLSETEMLFKKVFLTGLCQEKRKDGRCLPGLIVLLTESHS